MFVSFFERGDELNDPGGCPARYIYTHVSTEQWSVSGRVCVSMTIRAVSLRANDTELRPWLDTER